MANNVLTLDDTNFDTTITDTSRPIIVDFSATWCGPCKKLEPILQTFAGEVGTAAVVGKVDVDLSPDLANRYNIRSLPTILSFRDGKVVGQLNGLVNVTALRGLLG